MLLKMDPRKRYWEKDLDQTEGVVERDMLMFFEIYGGPVLYALYRVEVPYLSPPSELQQSIEFRPILELPSSEFPNAISCIQIDTTKFYFVAGEFEPSSRPNHKNCDRNIYLLDTAHIDKNNSNHHDLVKKNVVGSLISGKSNPYCFETLGKIYVMDTTGLSFMRSSSGSYFEVFDPSTGGQCLKLPNPPVILLTRGHALVDKKLFLSGLAGGSSRHVICFDLETNQWVQDFFQEFPYRHFLWGEGKLIGSDNLFAISGTAPTLFNFSPERVQQHLAATNSKDDENLTGHDDTDLSDDDTDEFEFEFDPPPALLFDDFALPSHNLRVIHKLANYHDHMAARLVDLDEGVFGYILGGKLPSYEKPEYIGMILVVFKPDLKLVTEEVNGETRKGFTGTLLHSAQFKFNSTDPVCNMLSCFSVPRESENADAAQANLQGL